LSVSTKKGYLKNYQIFAKVSSQKEDVEAVADVFFESMRRLNGVK